MPTTQPTIAERTAAMRALNPKTHAEIHAACVAIREAQAAAEAELRACDVARASLTGEVQHGAFEDCNGGDACPCGAGIHRLRRIPAYDLREAAHHSGPAGRSVAAAIAALPWGRGRGAENLYFVTNRRESWDGDRRVTLHHGRVEVASARIDRNGAVGALVIADPAAATTKATEAHARRKRGVEEYREALDTATRHALAGDDRGFLSLAVAVELGHLFDVEVVGVYNYTPGQKGGTCGSPGCPVSAAGVLRRAVKLRPRLNQHILDLRAYAAASAVIDMEDSGEGDEDGYLKAQGAEVSAVTAAGDGWLMRADAILHTVGAKRLDDNNG